jgi:hypothetical protein
MQFLKSLCFVAVVIALAVPDLVSAQAPGPDCPPSMYRGMPYGHFCPGHGQGPYGKRRVVKTADEAKQLVEAYFSSLGQNVSVGRIEERRIFYFVEILNSDGALIDKAIVDRRTGRIRSIY